jgi:hypothetical protein
MANIRKPGLAAALATGVAVALAGLGAGSAGALSAVDTDPTPLPAPVKARPQALEGGKDTPAAKDKMSSHSQELLIESQTAGKAKVTVMVLTAKGGTAPVVEQLKQLGATVGYTHDRTGYVRATLPTGKALEITRIDQVQHVDLDEMLQVPDPAPDPQGAGGAAAGAPNPWTGPSPTTPAVNPYLPTADTGAVQFKRDNPTYDGRGVTIGVLDSGVDLDHPGLQQTTTGERKITNWITVTDPLTEGDGTWRAMITRVKGRTAAYGTYDWVLPDRPGADFAISMFRESTAAANEEFKGDIDRDGRTNGAWGILYDYATGDIWVDVNGNHDFTDDTMMRPYRERYDVGHFGTDDPATPLHEAAPFVVEFRKGVDLTPAGRAGETADFVNIGVVSSAHGTHVAGIAAGKIPGWAMEGVAPGAKLVSAKACLFAGGCTVVALTEGMIELVANQHVDVVNLSIGGLPALNDGNNARSALYNRLIDEYGVQLFVSAGNSGPGGNTIGDPSVATDVVSVAAGASKDTWLANYGAAATAAYWVQNYSSHGPREDGGFKPNLMAPGSAISFVPMFWKADQLAEAGYTVAPGFAMFNGTSMASPQATGGAALLLSGARQSDLAVTPRLLRASLYATADFIPDVPADAQGNGLLRVDRAWPVLKRSPKVDNAYTVAAPVCSALGNLLATPNKGQGVYNRCPAGAGGHQVGEAKTYDVTITRTAGPANDVTHALRWVGNDGTFSSARTVDLPLGTPVTVKVTATPQSTGDHSAILNVDVPGAIVHGAQLMASVVVADSLEAAPYTASMSGTVERVRTRSMFVTVPKGAKALQVNLGGLASGSMVRFLAINPYGVPMDAYSGAGAKSCFSNVADAAICAPNSRAYLNPLPGVWEIQVDASRRTPLTANPFRVTAAVQGVVVTPATQTLESATIGTPVPLKWTVENRFGDATVTGKGGPLGSARSDRPTIAQGETRTTVVAVPAGTARLDVKIGNPGDKSADLDLYLKDSAGNVVAMSADGDAEEAVSIPNPKADAYTIEVDGYDAGPTGKTAYDYLDVFYGSGLGTLSVDPKTVPLRKGEQTTMTGTITAAARPAEGRRLFGEFRVVNSEGTVLGTGEVVIAEVKG